MKFIELTAKEFSKIENNMPGATYLQTTTWANIKKANNWESYYIGVKDDSDKIIAASLLLARKILLNKKIFYSPRGLMLDYKNTELLNFMIDNIKVFVKKHDGFMLKIDPLVEYRHHNSDGDIIDEEFNNIDIHNNLVNLGFKHKGFRVGYVNDLQYRWSYAIDISNKTYDEVFASFSSKGRNHIRKACKYPFIVKDVNEENLKDFKEITEHTAERHNHFDRTTDYYKSLIDGFSPENRIRIFVLYLDKKKYLKDFTDDKMYEEIKKEEQDLIPISCAMFIMDKDVVNYVYSGSYSKYNYFNASYMIQNEMIKWATEKHYKTYDFGGISGNFELDSQDYGVYAFKKNFNGRVIEYIGEYDLVINKFFYALYIYGYDLYRNSKKLLAKIKNK
ncbi:MAG TPA: hypothetical protein DCE23_05545 [Firmicutes bacterium]|nr:hypothetical protein [Bacillota bacterium]